MKRLLSLLSVAACLACHAAERPNIVWINCEDLDATLACYGDPFAITPNLDALAEDAVLFRNAFANAPICAPARNCLITGMYPTSLGGQHLRCEITLPEFVKPFPVYLRDSGYFVSNYTKTDYNFSPDGIYDYWKRDFAPWRQRKGDEPFFSFIVLGTTHEGPGNHRDRYEQAVASLPPSKLHDPDKIAVPPYFPDSPKMRELWARYHDLVSAMDEQVGEIIGNLKADGLWEDTIVWFFSDHGHGLPRHKRWLMDSGLRVPLLVRVPEKFRHLAGDLVPGSESGELVSFLDFAPTVLAQGGVEVPAHMQGRVFLGDDAEPAPAHVYGARDRADDMFELSRSVHDGRFIYIRHFMPHLPYIQGGRIMGDQKESMAELRRARDAGELDANSALIWADRKPVEELYDLSEDPYEIRNLANDPRHASRLATMRTAMKAWVLGHRDTGFLHEAEYQLRAKNAGRTIREMSLDPGQYDIAAVYDAADRATRSADTGELVSMLQSSDSGVRYWGATGFLARNIRPEEAAFVVLENASHDPSPSVAIAAAQVLVLNGRAGEGLKVLEEQIASEHPWVALQAARAMFDIGELAKPSVRRIEEVRRSLEGDGGSRRYRDFNYASFTGWALEAALINCGAATWNDFN